jgi:hypothetical protein
MFKNPTNPKGENMPDPWLSEEELEQHNKDVENHPLTKEAEEAKSLAEKDEEKAHKEAVENRKKVESGELVEVRANGAVVGYRDADQVDDSEVAQAFAEGVKPKEDGAGAATEGELGTTSGDPAPSGGGEVTGGTAKLADALEEDDDKKSSKRSSKK